jgi:hypothetical protein
VGAESGIGSRFCRRFYGEVVSVLQEPAASAIPQVQVAALLTLATRQAEVSQAMVKGLLIGPDPAACCGPAFPSGPAAGGHPDLKVQWNADM